jgi:hypothetical protein
MKTLETIRQQYPQPISSADVNNFSAEETCYCVGGALMLAHGLETRQQSFPTADILARNLLRINPALDKLSPTQIPWAYTFAVRMIRLNDRDKFEEAWEVAGKALAFR